MTPPSEETRPTLGHALIPVISLIILIFGAVLWLKADPHIPLVLATAIASLIGIRLGMPWSKIQQGIVEGISIGLAAILILMVIGMMIGTWIASGIVPILIYYGLKILNPAVFLVAACAICCVVSIATGSSWTTAGTVGIALIGVGQGLSIPAPMVAGAIISGAYFGDKMSPLSDSTNLAPAVAGSELFEHIQYMIYTTAPALLIALVLYLVLGFAVGGEGTAPERIDEIRSAIAGKFNLNPLLIVPPCLIVLMVWWRIPALPALLGGAVLGAICAMVFQGASIGDAVSVAHYGFKSETGDAAVDELLTRGGLDDMMFTVSLILAALSFGGVMEKTGMLGAIAAAILKRANTDGKLIAATVGSCAGMNVVAPDQYLSIIVPGRMFKEAYRERGLHAKNLSRALEDGGTLTSPLAPWNTCGAYMGATLGVSAFAYAPFAFFNLLCPIISIAIGFMGWRIARIKSPS